MSRNEASKNIFRKYTSQLAVNVSKLLIVDQWLIYLNERLKFKEISLILLRETSNLSVKMVLIYVCIIQSSQKMFAD